MKFEATARTFELTVETSESVTIRRIRKIASQWCPGCGRDTRMSKPEDAATLTGITARKIYAEIEDGLAHFTQSTDGSLMVCLRSLIENSSRPQFCEGELDQS